MVNDKELEEYEKENLERLKKEAEKNPMSVKCVILAGGYGTRITEESYLKPKPMN